MVLSMDQWAHHTQKASKIIKIISFKGSRGVLQGGCIYTYTYTYMYIYTESCTLPWNALTSAWRDPNHNGLDRAVTWKVIFENIH